MLAKHHRLRSPRDFSQVYRSGRKAVSDHLVVRVLDQVNKAQLKPAEPSLLADQVPSSTPVEPVKVGIVVSQKVHRRAVVRNRLKRQIRAIIATLIPDLPPNLWIVINLRPGAEQCEYGEFLRELKKLFTKLEVLHGHS